MKIDYWSAQGATAVKLYTRMSGDALRAATAHAHNHGLKVIGHLGATGWKDAMEAGVDELCHGLDALPEAGLKARLVNGRAAYEGLDQLDLKEPRYAAILQAASLMRERAKAIGGQLEVRSERGTGTEVDLTIPAPVAYTRHAGRRFRLFTSKAPTNS